MTFTQMLSDALARVVAFLPNLLAGLLILAVGLLLASLLARGTHRLLTSAELHRHRGVRRLVDNEQMLTRLPRTVSRIVYWSLALVTIGLAIDALHLSWLSVGVARVLAYLPSVLAAGVILLGGYLLGSFVYQRGAHEAGDLLIEHPAPRLWPGLLRAAIYVIAGFMALQQLGIATTIVNSAFIIGLSAIGIAGAVAFGLGNRELAGRIMRDWYERRRSEREDARAFPTDPPPIAQH